MEPRVHRFPGGWAASSDCFATFAATREEAIRQFRMHAPESAGPAEGDGGPDPMLEGMELALTHRHVELVRGPEDAPKRSG